jgi:DNA-binding transcriptional regulator YhcF (GntR family)
MPAIDVDFSRFKMRSDVAAHRQIAGYLKILIALGDLNPGDSVPGVPALAYRLKTTQKEVRRAYEDLAERGFLTCDDELWVVSDEHHATRDDRVASAICARLLDLIAEARKAGLTRAELQRMCDHLIERS